MNKNQPKIELADTSTIDAYSSIAREFFRAILGLSPDEVLATDESRLSDFGSCLPEAAEPQLEHCKSLHELYSAWDPLVLNLIEACYGFRPKNTQVLLIELFREIDVRKRSTITH
jgi:hypothetical protein